MNQGNESKRTKKRKREAISEPVREGEESRAEKRPKRALISYRFQINLLRRKLYKHQGLDLVDALSRCLLLTGRDTARVRDQGEKEEEGTDRMRTGEHDPLCFSSLPKHSNA